MNTGEELKHQELSLKLFVVLSRATRAITGKIHDDIRGYGLNPTEFAVLELLYHKGDQPIQQIGKKVLITSGSITYVVDKLEGKHYLRRRACPKDRRVTYAVLTDEGRALMDRIFPKHREAIHKIFGGLDADEKRQMIGQLKKLGYYAEEI